MHYNIIMIYVVIIVLRSSDLVSVLILSLFIAYVHVHKIFDSLATSARRAPRIAAALLCWTGLSAFKVCSACWPDMAVRELESPKSKREMSRLAKWTLMNTARSSNAALDANFRPPRIAFLYTALQVGVFMF